MRVLSTIVNLFLRGPTEVATDVVQNIASKKMEVVFDRVTGSVHETTRPFFRDSITKSNSNLFKGLADEMRKESKAEHTKKTRDRTEAFKIHSMRPKVYLFNTRTAKTHKAGTSIFSRPSLFDASKHLPHSNRNIVTRGGRTGHLKIG